VSVFAALRPGVVDLLLFLHVLGAMLLVGSVAAGVVAAFIVGPPDVLAWARSLVFRTYLLLALPAFFLMRVFAEWVRTEEFGDSDVGLAWIGIGYSAADAGGILLIAGIVLAWLGARRGRPRLTRAAAIVAAVGLVGWLIAVWAMGAKPA
jgi:hypothetical protein